MSERKRTTVTLTLHTGPANTSRARGRYDGLRSLLAFLALWCAVVVVLAGGLIGGALASWLSLYGLALLFDLVR